MDLNWQSLRGDDHHSVRQLRNRVSQFTRSGLVTNFKIGITGNPAARLARYVSDGEEYDEMTVVLKTHSADLVRELEKDLIDHNGELADNLARGGGPLTHGPYYLYVVRDFAWP